MSKNERKTENFVRKELERLAYYDLASVVLVEDQKSEIAAVKKLLRAGSKSGRGGAGAPEFIISSTADPDFLIVVECKADTRDHLSPLLKKTLAGCKLEETDGGESKRLQRYAADGGLHYAKALSKEFSVIVLAVSGQTKASTIVSTYFWPKGSSHPGELSAKDGAKLDKIIPWRDYIEHATFDPIMRRLRFDELMSFAAELHNFMRDYAKLTESQKPLLVSGTLIALKNDAFALSYGAYKPNQLQREWMRVIQDEISAAEIPEAKKDKMTVPYASIGAHPELGKATTKYQKGVLHELIKDLKEKVWPFISVYHDFDVVGQFYGEFLKYTGGDQKSLGIVLTPRHITELFALLANVNKNSKVLDICAGTGGFLISAMHQMIKTTKTAGEVARIKQSGLIGVEQQPEMFALAASNMILRGDGKANLYQGSCFDPKITASIVKHACGIGLINPPYSQSDSEQHELRFVKHMLDCLISGGTGIAIVPMSCALAANALRGEILRNHTLEAVMSMPDQLFYPVGTVTCIMVFTAHRPHDMENRKSWFGYWKDDGFVKTKNKGRIDKNDSWPIIRDRWVEAFRNREVFAGKSVLHKVTSDDEWCAEAYMETDYSKITKANFEETVRNYAIFCLLGSQQETSDEDLEKSE